MFANVWRKGRAGNDYVKFFRMCPVSFISGLIWILLIIDTCVFIVNIPNYSSHLGEICEDYSYLGLNFRNNNNPFVTLSHVKLHVWTLLRSRSCICIYRFSGKINWSSSVHLPIPIHEMKTFHCLSSQDTIAHNCRWSSLKINCRNEMVKKEVEHAYNECIYVRIYTRSSLRKEKKKKKNSRNSLSPTLLKLFIRKLG